MDEITEKLDYGIYVTYNKHTEELRIYIKFGITSEDEICLGPSARAALAKFLEDNDLN